MGRSSVRHQISSAGLPCLILIMVMVFSSVSWAEPEIVLTPEYREKVIQWIRGELDSTYVFPEVATEMSDFLSSRLIAGAYDDVKAVEEFTALLTQDLQSISHDKHLRVRYAPEPMPSGDASEAERQRRRERQLQRAKRDNFGFRKIEVLNGNVGYLRFDGFMDAGIAGDTAIAAMNFLSHCDALIIDLRQNGGGSPTMIQLITSYFFEEPKHLNSFYIRKSDSTEQFWTYARVEGKRLLDTRLFLLTSSRTFSAAEEFTYNLKAMERATIVGETTGGGAHPVDYHQSNELKIGVNVPFGRAINPITETNWEGTGVEPHVQVSADKAFDRAYTLALEAVRDNAEQARKEELDWLIEYREAVDKPFPALRDDMQAYVGNFGPRTITLEEGQLYYQRDGRPRGRLYAVSKDRFALEDAEYFRIEFERDDSGAVIAIQGHYLGGRQDRSPRSTTASEGQ